MTTISDATPLTVRRGALTLRGLHRRPSRDLPTTLLLPGGGQTMASWSRTAADLAAAGLGTLTVDLRGHGESDWAPDADYGVDALAEDVVSWCNAAGEPPVVVGASLGGLTALLTAGEHPGAVRGLVVVDIAIDSRQVGVDRVLDFMAGSRSGFDSLEEFSLAVAGYTGRPPRPAEHMRRHARQGADGRWYWHWDPEFMDKGPDFSVARDRLVAAAGRIRVPTLLVRGERSDVVRAEDLEALRALIPHAEVLEVAGAGHMITSDDNDVFAAGLAAFATRT